VGHAVGHWPLFGNTATFDCGLMGIAKWESCLHGMATPIPSLYAR
jgi:hypothetical protein